MSLLCSYVEIKKRDFTLLHQMNKIETQSIDTKLIMTVSLNKNCYQTTINIIPQGYLGPDKTRV